MKQKTPIWEQISMNHRQLALMLKIRRKGRDEQERQYLFSGLYGSKAVTKNTRGLYKMYERKQISSYTKIMCPR